MKKTSRMMHLVSSVEILLYSLAFQEESDVVSRSTPRHTLPHASNLATADASAANSSCMSSRQPSLIGRFPGLPLSPSSDVQPDRQFDVNSTKEEGGRGQHGYAALMSTKKPSTEGIMLTPVVGQASYPLPEGLPSIHVVRPAYRDTAPAPSLANIALPAEVPRSCASGNNVAPSELILEKLPEAAMGDVSSSPVNTHSGMSPEAIMSALSSLMPSEEQQMELKEILHRLSYVGNQELQFEKVNGPYRTIGGKRFHFLLEQSYI